MSSLSNRIEEARERAMQETRRRVREDNREKDRHRKIATRRQITVGGIVIKYFPGVVNLEPKLNRKDSNAEFVGLDKFFHTVSNDPSYTALFQELVGRKK